MAKGRDYTTKEIQIIDQIIDLTYEYEKNVSDLYKKLDRKPDSIRQKIIKRISEREKGVNTI